MTARFIKVTIHFHFLVGWLTSLLFLDIHIKWTKAHAHADCWRKELILLEEEMRQVLKFCGWKARW
ncbi:hypothetical protein DFH08DRAFT_676957 [Mycena albidolilacea]|uniref:Transmembrane protein n=1 Tax=Mycena albidolilacea TaxID=1033008 RepID=A0AAD7AV48_9AGAR|nr:hypothetical protein DFH08DRAFT_676957 [Mycena albidolilacea]